MIYLVTNSISMFEAKEFSKIDAKAALDMIMSWEKHVNYDSETLGKDAHVGKILCAQFGRIDRSDQVVVDCHTVDIRLFKDVFLHKIIIGQNLKFDLQWLYNFNITPLEVYDTMVIEQLLYLGYPYNMVGADDNIIERYFKFTRRHAGDIQFEKRAEYRHMLLVREEPAVAEFMSNHSGVGLKALEYRYLGINMDKSVRGQIQWRGLDTSVIVYAAGDVVDLNDIRLKQLEKCKEQGINNVGIALENKFVPVIAYLEWCGIKMDEVKWSDKMKEDAANVTFYLKKLNDFLVANIDKYPKLNKFKVDDGFFTGMFDTVLTINWSSPSQVVEVAKILGFNTKSVNKLTGEEGDSVLEKVLKFQKGINDEFLDIYFKYKGCKTLVSSFGQKYLNAINPNTGRLHTVFRQLGTASGRMACGSDQINTDLAKLKGLPISKDANKTCVYPQLQNLPADDRTRSCFIASKGNKFCSCDYSSLEARLGADIYEEKAMIDEYLHGSGDMHSLMALTFFEDQLGNITTKEVKAKYPELRKKAKSPEFDLKS